MRQPSTPEKNHPAKDGQASPTISANGGGDSLKRVPRTKDEWCAYRCQLSCEIGRDVLDGKTKPPAGVSPLEYAVFNLLHAVQELSRQNSQIK